MLPLGPWPRLEGIEKAERNVPKVWLNWRIKSDLNKEQLLSLLLCTLCTPAIAGKKPYGRSWKMYWTCAKTCWKERSTATALTRHHLAALSGSAKSNPQLSLCLVPGMMLHFFLLISCAAALDEHEAALKQDSECTSAECTLSALQLLGTWKLPTHCLFNIRTFQDSESCQLHPVVQFLGGKQWIVLMERHETWSN